MIPTKREELVDAGYVFDGEGYCRGCGAAIEWWITPSGKKMPMSVQEIKKEGAGFFAPVIGYKRVAHWGVCPNASDFKR
jgi:hypothetical protein